MDGEVRPRVRRPGGGPPSCFPCLRSRRRACKEEEESEEGLEGGGGVEVGDGGGAEGCCPSHSKVQGWEWGSQQSRAGAPGEQGGEGGSRGRGREREAGIKLRWALGSGAERK